MPKKREIAAPWLLKQDILDAVARIADLGGDVRLLTPIVPLRPGKLTPDEAWALLRAQSPDVPDLDVPRSYCQVYVAVSWPDLLASHQPDEAIQADVVLIADGRSYWAPGRARVALVASELGLRSTLGVRFLPLVTSRLVGGLHVGQPLSIDRAVDDAAGLPIGTAEHDRRQLHWRSVNMKLKIDANCRWRPAAINAEIVEAGERTGVTACDLRECVHVPMHDDLMCEHGIAPYQLWADALSPDCPEALALALFFYRRRFECTCPVPANEAEEVTA